MNKNHVLIVDDEWNMRNLLRVYLTKEGFQTTQAATGAEAIALLARHSFAIILLDVMMPDMDGWQICRTIRQTNTAVPILMLTARSETRDKVQGLGIGADDYMTKPFDYEELLARIQSLIRRAWAPITASLPAGKPLVFHPLAIFPEAREARVQDVVVEFTQKEFELLLLLARNGNRTFSRDELLERVWPRDYEGGDRVVDTHVKNIREKLKRAGMLDDPVKTVWGIGYKFQSNGDKI